VNAIVTPVPTGLGEMIGWSGKAMVSRFTVRAMPLPYRTSPLCHDGAAAAQTAFGGSMVGPDSPHAGIVRRSDAAT
jgi:hypothetical protein